MWEFRERREQDLGTDALTFVLGAAGGFALGLLMSGRVKGAARAGGERARSLGGNLRDRAETLRDRAGTLRERARTVASRLRPARLRRPAGEQSELTELEDAVLDAFLGDDVLSERGIDVGAISHGIIELSGSVYSEEEARHAVRMAEGVRGVRTVVNRMEVERPGRTWDDGGDELVPRGSGAEWTGLQSGMGRRRQGKSTDPDRSDDSRHIREVSMEITDRSEFDRLGYAAQPRNAERSEDSRGNGPRGYSEDELDNQDPVGPHTYGGVPRAPTGSDLNPGARVGEGLKPGTELRLEGADVPVKPHGEAPRADDGSDRME